MTTLHTKRDLFRFFLVSLVVLAGFLAAWLPAHPSRPLLAVADVYEHLTVARHLCRGEGFLTDVAYPLSFAFPFARELPQPLVHRQPGFSVLLTVPYMLAGGDPSAAVAAVRVMQIILMSLIVLIGTFAFLRRDHAVCIGPWLVILFLNPLLAYMVDWGAIEVSCALVLLTLWLRIRDGQHRTPDWFDGTTAGILGLLRLDLVWVPILWWFWFRWERRKLDSTIATAADGADATGAGKNDIVTEPSATIRRSFMDRRFIVALLIMVLLMIPWAFRNSRLTGEPFFSVQSHAEHVKMSRAWPDYRVYRQLEPQPFFRTLTSEPLIMARKIARGISFYIRHLGRFFPWPFWFVSGLAALLYLAGLFYNFVSPFRRKRAGPMSILAVVSRAGPLAAASLTLILLIGQYAFFNHNLRHVMVLLPIMAWELSYVLGALNRAGFWRTIWSSRPRIGRMLDMLAPVLLVILCFVAFPTRMPGWEGAAEWATIQAQELDERVAAAKVNPDPVLFVEWSAVPWYADRAAVWSPLNDEVRAKISEYLTSPSE